MKIETVSIHRPALFGIAALLLACGSAGSISAPEPTSDTGGAAGDASAGQGGANSGASGSGGAATSAGGSGTAASSGNGSGAGGKAGATGGSATGGAGASAGSNPFGGATAAGGSGTAGSTSAGIIPKTCKQAHDASGCCGPDGHAYYCKKGVSPVIVQDCTATGKVCGWSSTSTYYGCVSSVGTDPAGSPIVCGP